MKRKWLIRGGLVVGILFALVASAFALSYASGGAYYESEGLSAIALPVGLRTWAEHDALYPQGNEPYLFEARTDRGALLYYGAKHSNDVNHPQKADIAQRWEAFRPTVALCEGRARGYLVGPIFERFMGLPEPALVTKLARRGGVPLYTLEPKYEDEVGELLERWPAEQIAMYFTMSVYWSESSGTASESLALELLGKRTGIPALAGALSSVADMDRVWKAIAPGAGDWRTQTSSPRNAFFDTVSDASRAIRGAHMSRVLIDLAGSGERVFAVVGCSHVIRQEPGLQAAVSGLPLS